MVEQDRQRYLAQFGVAQWYARSVIPGAASSPEFEFAELAAAPVKNSAQPQSRTDASHLPETTARRSPVSVGVPAKITQLKSPVAGSLADQVQAGEVGKNSTPEAFLDTSAENDSAVQTLAKVIAGKIILVADLSGDEAIRDQEISLLQNIAKAISAEGDLDEIEQFSWPPLPQANLPGHTRQMKEALLQRWMQSVSGTPLVFMGQNVPGFLSQTKILPLMSLASLLRRPVQKKEVWQRLSQFVQSAE